MNFNKKGGTQMHIFYIGKSIHTDETAVLTVGITKNPRQREYLKHMAIVLNFPCSTKADALLLERNAKKWLKKNHDLAFVKYGPAEFPSPPNRGWDWWLIDNHGKVQTSISNIVRRLQK